MTDELARLQRLVGMLPPTQLACLRYADEIIQSGLLGPEWLLVDAGQHNAGHAQRIVRWERRKEVGSPVESICLIPPLRSNEFRCHVRSHGATRESWPCGMTATEAVTGALAELDRYFERFPDVV